MKNNIKETTLILGNGFLGKEFIRQGYKHFTTSEQLRFKTPKESLESENNPDDVPSPIQFLSKLENIIDYLEINDSVKIDTIINCIGKADTRYCEDKNNFNDDVLHINGFLPELISRFCRNHNIKFVQISTGCLYTSANQLVNETSFIEAHCNYTLSKWIGEMGCDYNRDLIIRPRLYFSDIRNKLNLLCKFENFKYILNEFNSITSTRTIVEAVTALLQCNQVGVFNVANDGIYTIKEISEAIGYKWLPSQVITGYELRKQQGLYLVNNTMDISKLKQFYIPRDAIEEFKWCADNLH